MMTTAARTTLITFRPADEEVAAGGQRSRPAATRPGADQRFRRVMDHAAVGICLVTPDGHFVEVNDAICRFFGYDAETLTQKTWRSSPPGYLEEDLNFVNDVLAVASTPIG